MGGYLMGVYLTGVHLMGYTSWACTSRACISRGYTSWGIHLIGVHFTGMCLMGVYLIGMHLGHVPHRLASILEGFCEDLARQNAVTQLSQLQLRFRRRHMGFYVVAYGFQSPLGCPKDYYLGCCTVCLGTSAHRPCFDLSVCLQFVCLSPVCPSLFCLSDWLANPIAYASFPRLTLPHRR
jgi:hypothetical protein